MEYKDVFRRNYSDVFQVDVEIPRLNSETRQESGPGWLVLGLVAGGLLAIAIAAYAYAGRRRRREPS